MKYVERTMEIRDDVVYIDLSGQLLYYGGCETCMFSGTRYHKFVQCQEYGDAYHYGYVTSTIMVEWQFLFPTELGK